MDIMRTISPLHGDQRKKLTYFFALTTFFYAITNGITSYYFPILALETGLSYAAMGVLYSTSSVFGALFDLLLSKYLKDTNYKRLQIYAIVLAITFPLLIVSSSMIAVYVIAVAVWALYSNLSTFAYYDFPATEAHKQDHAQTFASLSVFNDLGYVVAPLIAGLTVIKIGDFRSVTLPIVTGVIALLFVLLTISISKNQQKKNEPANNHPARSFKKELRVLFRVGVRLWPILLLMLNLTIMEAAFWTVSPIIERFSGNLKGMGGLVLSLSMVPSLIISWSVAPLTKSFGKKNTAFYSFLFSNVLLLGIGYVTNAYVILITVFLVNLLEAITYPAAHAALADYLKESTSYDNEIIAVEDLFANIGYIIGPAFAGIAMDLIGDLRIFSIIAVLGILSSLVLIAFSPKKIPFADKYVEKQLIT